MDIRTIKGIDEETWMKFKMLAVKRRVTMGRLLINMLETYEKNTDEFWNSILSGKKIISDKEAEEMHKTVKKLRKEWGFRRESNF